MLTEEMLKDGHLSLTRPFTEKDPNTIELTCDICGKKKRMSVQQITVATSVHCNACAAKDELDAKLTAKYGKNPYEILSLYHNNRDPIKVRCKDCGYEFEISPYQLFITKNYPEGAHPCRGCSKIRIRDAKIREFYNKEILQFGKVYHEVVNPDEFTDMFMTDRIKVKCTNCHTEFDGLPVRLSTTEEYYCPTCHPEFNPDIIPEPNDISVKTAGELGDVAYDFNKPIIRVLNDVSVSRATAVRRKLNTNLKEFKSFLYELGIIIIENEVDLVPDVVLEFYIPDQKVAINFCQFKDYNEEIIGQKAMQQSYIKCKEKGIRIIHIYEDEWVSRRMIVKDKIKYILHLTEEDENIERIYARNCYIKEVEADVKNAFLEKNHIQGKDTSTIKLGLYTKKNDKLVSILTFGCKRVCMGIKKTFDGEYELIRFASDITKIVIGAFSKLLNYFIKIYKPKMITTFSDLRYSDTENNLYDKNHFVFSHMTKPNYWYYKEGDTTKRYHRYNFRKQELTRKLDVFDPNMTEKENCHANNYYALYDCGNILLTIDFRTDEEKALWEQQAKDDKIRRAEARANKNKVEEEIEDEEIEESSDPVLLSDVEPAYLFVNGSAEEDLKSVSNQLVLNSEQPVVNSITVNNL